MSDILTPDICVIGGGSGGLTVAATAAAFGVDVVLLEKGKMGGDCLNYGCVPSKAIIAAGKHARSAIDGEKFGIKSAGIDVDFAKVNAIYATYFDEKTAPARACVQAARLPKDVKVEIECIAVIPKA